MLMKKIIVLLLAVLMCISVVACTPENTTKPAATPESTPETTPEPEKPSEKTEAMVNMKKEYDDFINYRNYLTNTYKKITEDKELKVLFFGGSLTQGYGSSDASKTSWRALTCNWFTTNFPEVNFEFINRAVGESGTFLGTYRLQLDVIDPAPDLIFLEYAINDKYFQSTYNETLSRCETIIREVKQALPETEIIMLITTDVGCFGYNKKGELHIQGQAHEVAGRSYGISTLHVGRLLAKESDFDTAVFREKYAIDIVHLNDDGNSIVFNCVAEYLENSLKNTDFSQVKQEDSSLREDLVSMSLFDGNRTHIQPNPELLAESEALGGSGVTYGDKAYTANSYSHGVYVMDSTEDVLVIKFTGTELALWCNLKNKEYYVSIDGGEYITQATTEHSPAVLAKDLTPGEHIIKFKLKEEGSKVTIGSIFTRDDSLATR